MLWTFSATQAGQRLRGCESIGKGERDRSNSAQWRLNPRPENPHARSNCLDPG